MNEPLSPDSGRDAPHGTVEYHPTLRDTGFSAVLRNRSFLAIWLAQVASQTAQNSLWYLLIVLVSNEKLSVGSTARVGLTIILVQVPTVLFSGVSGVLVDRVSKQMILVGTNAIRVFGVVAYIFFQRNILGLEFATFLVAVVSQPFAPAEGACLPLLVKREELTTANSLFQLTFMTSQAVGFAVSPIAIAVLGITTTLVVLGALFSFSALILLSLPAITKQHAPNQSLGFSELSQRVMADLREVVIFIFRDPPLAVALLQIALAPTLLLVLAEVGPDFLAHVLGIGHTSTSLFFLLAPAGAGLGVGMFILGQFSHRLRKERLVLVALLALGVTVIGLASVPTLSQYWVGLQNIGIHVPLGVQKLLTVIPIALMLGIEVAFINAPVQTIVQQRARPELRGRVLAMQQTLTAAMAIPPLVLVGGIATLVGTPATLSLMGVLIVIIGLVIVYYA